MSQLPNIPDNPYEPPTKLEAALATKQRSRWQLFLRTLVIAAGIVIGGFVAFFIAAIFFFGC